MRRECIGILFIIGCFKISYSEIKIRIYEPIRFKNINTRGVGELIVGGGSLEITSDNLEEDLNKKLVFKFPEKGALTNKKRWLKIEKYDMGKNEKKILITAKKRVVKVYAVIKREELKGVGLDAESIEGEYIGAVPIFIEQYSKGTQIGEEVEKN